MTRICRGFWSLNMPMHDPSHSNGKGPGYETTDANIGGVVAFLVVLVASLAVFFVVCFGIGKLINEALVRHDGPESRWNQQAGITQQSMASNPVIEQQQLRDLVAKFPKPRLQTDDGNADVVALHAREDLLLNHYTWADEQKQTVRIPIARAMQILAAQGLPVETAGKTAEPQMYGDASMTVAVPLTNGFARTGPELQQMAERRQRLGLEAESKPAQ
jgi:hypothetical protein